MSENLYSLLRERFPRDLSQPFLETETGLLYSYRDFDQLTSRYATFLTRLGLSKGDRVLVQVEKSPPALFLCFACFRAGLAYVPLNPADRRNEVQYLLADAGPKVVLCRPEAVDEYAVIFRELKDRIEPPQIETLDEQGDGSFTEKCRSIPPIFGTTPCAGSDLAALLYTSGTTGQPKGAMLTHRNLAANFSAVHDFWQWRATDILLHSLPLYHVHGLFISSLCALLGGTKILYLPRFDAASVTTLLPRATVFMGVPTYYTRLLAHPRFGKDACHNMRLFVSGSAPLLAQTFREFEERTGFPILERYAMTEAGVITSNPVDGPRLPGTVGMPLPGVAVRVADDAGNVLPAGEVGEVQIQGESVFGGYWRKPEETAASLTADGFFKTGDLGRWGANGYLSIVGRSKDLVISGGLNIYPKEVEVALDQIEGVVESAVIGVPHPDFGEAVVAVVVRDKGRDELTEAALIAKLKEQMAGYKIPKRVFFLDELPRNAMGKVQKNLLCAQPEYRAAFSSVRQSGGAPFLEREPY